MFITFHNFFSRFQSLAIWWLCRSMVLSSPSISPSRPFILLCSTPIPCPSTHITAIFAHGSQLPSMFITSCIHFLLFHVCKKQCSGSSSSLRLVVLIGLLLPVHPHTLLCSFYLYQYHILFFCVLHLFCIE